MASITPITMPKWGLAMTEGTVTTWRRKPGETFQAGEDLVEIETSKINNVYEAPFAGRLSRIVAGEGQSAPVGGLIAVSADAEVGEAELDAFVEAFQSRFVPEDADQTDRGDLQISIVTVRGASLRYWASGPLTAGAVPTVLIHGYSGDLNTWLFNLDSLASRGPVIALELPGHGASAKRLESGSLSELSAAMQGALAALGIGRCDLVGHSLGAAVAMRIALDHQALVRRIVLVAPVALPGTALNQAFVEGLAGAQSIRQLQPILAELFADLALATREMADEVMRYKRLDGADEALALIAAQMLVGADFTALRARLDELPPAVVVTGRLDRIVGRPDPSALPAGWRVVELDAGHMPHMERAGDFNTLMAEALG